jgi:TnpA family transposase
LEWLQSPEHRRRVQIGLNKGEAKHGLARSKFFNQLGEVRDRSYEDQLHRASALQLIVSAIVSWNTVYMKRAITPLRAKGVKIPEEYLQHISPLGWEHIALTGDYVWNLKQDGTIDQLRPLRVKK